MILEQEKKKKDLIKIFGGMLLLINFYYFFAYKLDIFNSGFSGADEPSHFINTYFFWDYFRFGDYFHPFEYAKDFYISFPKLAIGHWPPLHYLLTSFLFLFFPATDTTIMWVHFFVSFSVIIPIIILIKKIGSLYFAFLGAGLYLFSPLSIGLLSFYMLDQPLVLLCLFAVINWYYYSKTSEYKYIILYSVFTTMAIYTKGNGWFLGLLPCIHIILGNYWYLLKKRRTYIGGGICIVLTVPWYYITTKISADGFNFSFGLEYAVKAFISNLNVLINNVGVLGLILLIFCLFMLFREKDSEIGQIGKLSLSAFLAVLIFHSLVPVALAPRYMLPALPFLVILEIIALIKLMQLLKIKYTCFNSNIIITVFGALILFFPLQKTFAIMPQVNLLMDKACEFIDFECGTQVILVDGSSGGEGACIAEILMSKKSKDIFVIRSSKLLSDSNFMGNKYKLKVSSIDQLGPMLKKVGIKFIIIEKQNGRRSAPHSELLIKFLESGESDYIKIAALSHINRAGVTFIFSNKNKVIPDLKLIHKISYPNKMPKI